ncbi:uncharacterized protein LOC106467868, partial [Limulus polyphemus]|uniref:Uncharacterized protein LOC106467868 n=1 Tax=Limulus polyphemus TaxID=6850 RepID=A0ABM1BKB8_LIMPO
YQQPRCFYSKNPIDQKLGEEATKASDELSSNSMDGLNLECGSLQKTTQMRRNESGSEINHNRVDQKLAELDQLLKHKVDLAELDQLLKHKVDISERRHRKTSQEQKMKPTGPISETSTSDQDVVMRRVTNLRQRRISTQLKMDTLRKQLYVNSKKSNRPATIHEVPHLETQLRELKMTLQKIDSSLGSVEKQAEETLQKLSISHEDINDPEVKKRPLSDSTTFKVIDQHGKKAWYLDHEVSKSEEDCRRVHGKSKPAKFMDSLQSKRNFVRNDQLFQSQFALPLLNRSQTTEIPIGREATFQPEKTPRDRTLDSLMSSMKNRRGPLRLLGSFVDSQIRGRLGSQRRHKSVERLPTESHRDTQNFSLRSSTTEDIDDKCLNSTNLQEQVLRKQRLVKTVSTDSRSSEGSCGTSHVRPLKTDNKRNRKEENRKKSKGMLRTEIDPRALAEIEAFEKMAHSYLQNHRHDFPV